MIQEIKELRTNIDGLAQLTKELKPVKAKPDAAQIHKKYKELGGHGIFILKGAQEDYDKEIEVQRKLREFEDTYSLPSKEIEKTVDSLLLAKAWLGKIIGVLGEDTPYKNDGNRKTVEDIEPTADKVEAEQFMKLFTDSMLSYYNRKSHIEKIDFIREGIKKIIDTAPDFSELEETIELEQGFVYKYLSEARFWLGFELGRIRDNE